MAVASAPSEFVVVDLTNADGPVVVGGLSVPGQGTRVSVTDDGATAAVASGPVTVLDLSSPRQPAVVGEMPFEDARDVALSGGGDAALVLDSYGLHTVDLTDRSAPILRASLELGSSLSLSVSPDFQTAVVGGQDGLAIVDVHDFAAPATIRRIEAGEDWPRDTTFSRDGKTLIVAEPRAVRIYDVSDPVTPVLVRQVAAPPGSNLTALTYGHDEASVFAVGDGAIHVMGLSDTAESAASKAYDIQAATDAAPLPGGETAIVTSGGGLALLDLRQPGHTALVGVPTGAVEDCRGASDVQLSPDGRTAFVAGEGLIVLDVTQRAAPAIRAAVAQQFVDSNFEQFVNLDLARNGETLFAVASDKLWAIDVRDPSAPTTVSVFDEPPAVPMAQDVAAAADAQTAFLVTEGGGGLDIIDMTQREAPIRLSHLYVRHTEGVVLSADQMTAFVADPYENGLLAIDVHDKAVPVVVGGLPRVVSAMALCPGGSTLVALSERCPGCLPEGETDLVLVDVREPSALTVISELEMGGAADRAAAVSDDCTTVFVADGATLRVVDITDASAPTHVSTFEVPGATSGVAVFPDGRNAIVATNDASTCAGIIDGAAAPRLEPTDGDTAAVRRYRLTWTDRFGDHPEQLAFRASAGEVAFTEVDQETSTALLEWSIPDDAPPDSVLIVAVGNYQYYQLARAGLTRR
jgi:hypothetical protein